jgi:hypothetical protein
MSRWINRCQLPFGGTPGSDTDDLTWGWDTRAPIISGMRVRRTVDGDGQRELFRWIFQARDGENSLGGFTFASLADVATNRLIVAESAEPRDRSGCRLERVCIAGRHVEGVTSFDAGVVYGAMAA